MTLSPENKALVEREGLMDNPARPFTIGHITLNRLLDAARQEGREVAQREGAAWRAKAARPL